MVYGFFGKKSSGSAATRARPETLGTRDKSAIKYKKYTTSTISWRVTQTNY